MVSLAAFVCLAMCRFASAAEPSAEDLEFFEKKVRPILVDVCQKCHGARKQESGLRLDSRAMALQGGEQGAALDSTAPEKSRLLAAIRYDGDLKMPPRGKLPAEQIEAVAEWMRRGAPWPAEKAVSGSKGEFDLESRRSQQWALQPIQSVEPPAVKHLDWVRNPIDQFLVAGLEGAGLAPAPLTDKRTLLRRVTYDLTGLPPTPAEIAAFLDDKSFQALQKVVDRLLDSPRYGERWARHWLDLVRYAETAGHEFDFEIPYAFEYRDYVIRALNQDVPYNQFVMEHVAGDLLPEPRRHPTERFNESILGTGFWFLGESKHSPVDIRVDAAERLDNQVDVFSKAFLAQTVACARCHDHKFDAISTRDYHALCGFVQSSRMQVVAVDPPEERLELARRAAEGERKTLQEAGNQLRQLDSAMIAKLLLATQDVLRPAPVEANEKPSPQDDDALDDVVFEDFEGKTYGAWKATGDAFGTRPNRLPLPEYQGNVAAIGQGLINSHSAFNDAGQRRATDELTGTLTSPAFKVVHPYIHFLVGGGAHPGKTCVNLKLGDKVMRTATGKNNNRMDWATFDVREFIGREATLEIVDAEKGGWGNIGVDHIVFSQSSLPLGTGKNIRRIARKHQLDADVLTRWVQYLKTTALERPEDPWNLWARWVNREGGPTANEWQGFLGEMRSQSRAALSQIQATSPAAIRFFDFREGYAGWFRTGEAFGDKPLTAPFLAASGPLNGAHPELPLAHSGGRLLRLQGALRSPSFEISNARILYRMAGQGTRLRLVIDQFQQIRYPIYGGLEIGLKSPNELQWHVQDVSKWVGHTAYIELLDEGDGFAVLEQVLFSDQGSPPQGIVNPVTDQLLTGDKTPTMDEFAKQVANRFTKALGRWHAPSEGGPDQTTVDAILTNWAVQQSLPADGLLRSLLPQGAKRSETLSALVADREKLEAGVVYRKKGLTLGDGTPFDERVHPRGNPNKFGDVVPRRFLESVGGADRPVYGPGSGRFELARRMTDPANPLVSRVMVNRLWKHHFGEGLVRTADDFGNMGQPPSHPELLDWLAGEFVRRGWSLKQMHRMMVLSRAYALSSAADRVRAEEVDPLNLLLHRANLRRLEAESIRDGILAVSGRLNVTSFGPSVMPHLTPFMIGRGRPGSSGALDGDGRRSIYLGVRRNFLNPMFQAFDAPVPFSTIGRRSVSNVPAQALAMLNNPFVSQQAELWARRVIAETKDDSERIRAMYESAYARLPDDNELRSALGFLEEQKQQYAGDDGLRAWTDLAHVLLNVKEFVWIP